MEQTFLTGFLNNITLLLALGFLYSFLITHLTIAVFKGKSALGLLFGIVAAIGMLYPVRYAPGIIFDGRTILLSIVGFFGGALSASIAVMITGILRIWQGGSGVWMGLASILSSAAIGVIFHRSRSQFFWLTNAFPLYVFGFIVHVAMIFCMFALPDDFRWAAIRDLSLPVLLIYPLATMLYGRLLVELEKRKNAVDDLRENQDFLAKIINAIGDPLFVKDRRHCWILLNDAYCELLGQAREGLIGKASPGFYSSEQALAVWEREEEVFVTGRSICQEERIIDFHNRERVLLTRESHYRDRHGDDFIVGTVRDITEQKRDEIALRESEERYRAMMQQSMDAILIVDIDTKRIMEVNDRCIGVFGYSREEFAGLTTYDIVADMREEVDMRSNMIAAGVQPPSRLLRMRRKDGRVLEMERSAALIQYGGKQVFMFVTHDLSAERKLQGLLLKDVSMASEVQKSLMPKGFDDVLISVQTIYAPYHMVSGDFYDFGWSQDHQRFSGYILDVSGHGVSSSLQGIAVSAYFREVLDSPMRLDSKLKWINRRVLRYFTDETYAAAIYFEFDFLKRTMSYAAAGIYGFLASSECLPEYVRQPGSLIGIVEAPEYVERTVPIFAGDTFYFMSDGIFDQLSRAEALRPVDFEQSVHKLRDLAESPLRNDDCSAICIRVSGRPSFPIRLELHRFGEYNRLRERLRNLLSSVANEEAGKISIALGEALNNAVRESMDMRVKLSLFGHRLVIRVKDSGPGFDGNHRVEAFARSEPGRIFDERLDAEGGRGIMIMLSWMDKVIYSRNGNEVLLMKRLPPRLDSTDGS